MRPSLVAQWLWRVGLLLGAAFVMITLLAMCMPGTLLLAGEDFSASGTAAEVRLLPGPASALLKEELRAADHALMQAIDTNDPLAAARLLDPEFTWIDRDGRKRKKSELANRMILLSARPDADVAFQPYGRVVLVTGTHRLTPDGVPALFARVWVRQFSGWRLLLYQETTAPDSTASDSMKEARYGFTRAPWPADCDNPCRSLPYKPLSPEAQEIVGSFMAGEKAVFEGHAEEASRIFGDDVLFVTPDSAKPLDKTQRMAALGGVRRTGEVDLPPAVASLDLWVFGNSAVMSVNQESPRGQMLRATSIWAKRDGVWQLAFSQQTLVQ